MALHLTCGGDPIGFGPVANTSRRHPQTDDLFDLCVGRWIDEVAESKKIPAEVRKDDDRILTHPRLVKSYLDFVGHLGAAPIASFSPCGTFDIAVLASA